MSFDLALTKTGTISFLYSPKLLYGENTLVVFTLRHGGASQSPYESLNLGLHVGDKGENVLKNRELLLSCFDLDISRLTTAEQVHGNAAVVVDDTLVGRGATVHEDSIPAADALISNLKNVPLILFYADCVPVVVVDPVKKCVAVVHAGWRGILEDIVSETISKMKLNYDAEVSDLLAYIGPCIGKCCFEVDQSLQELFGNKFDMQFKSNRIDLSQIVREELIREGMIRDKIYSAEICTSCQNDKFFSFRRASKTGRHGALVALLSKDSLKPF